MTSSSTRTRTSGRTSSARRPKRIEARLRAIDEAVERAGRVPAGGLRVGGLHRDGRPRRRAQGRRGPREARGHARAHGRRRGERNVGAGPRGRAARDAGRSAREGPQGDGDRNRTRRRPARRPARRSSRRICRETSRRPSTSTLFQFAQRRVFADNLHGGLRSTSPSGRPPTGRPRGRTTRTSPPGVRAKPCSPSVPGLSLDLDGE